jgi:hypothetical protein
MSNRNGDGMRLWSIRGPGLEVLFAGTIREVVDEVGRLDRSRRGAHAAIEVGRGAPSQVPTLAGGTTQARGALMM